LHRWQNLTGVIFVDDGEDGSQIEVNAGFARLPYQFTSQTFFIRT